jgi:hypothetical protein
MLKKFITMAFSINLAYYNKKDWKRFLEIIDDREQQHDKWEDWHKDYLKAKNGLLEKGFIVNDFQVDLDELIKYCKTFGLKIDGKARSRYVAKGGLNE